MKNQELLGILVAGTLASNSSLAQNKETKPNIVFIFCDDLGYGDLGCFGATEISTPNLDKMANDGMKFTEFYTASSVSSPSRAGLLTGRIPQRMGINQVFFPTSYTGMPTEEITIAEMLKKQGYATGMVGKWHLGHMPKYLPVNQGFDYYFGIPYSNDMQSVVYMRQDSVVEFNVNQDLMTQTYTEEALQFIEKQKDKPFFLYLSHNMPHVPLHVSSQFKGKSKKGLYGDVLAELDWSVGEVIKKLEALKLLENTLIVFSSDNGPWLVMQDYGGSSGILREGKMTSFEGGVRVPTLAMWKGKIKPKSVYNDMALMVDWFPTFANLAQAKLTTDRPYDGEDISEVLLTNGKRKHNEFIYFKGDKPEAYRQGDWKLKLASEKIEGNNHNRKEIAAHPILLFNLKNDPSEQNNLAEKMPDKVKEMQLAMENYRKSLGAFPATLNIGQSRDRSHYDHLEQLKNKE